MLFSKVMGGLISRTNPRVFDSVLVSLTIYRGGAYGLQQSFGCAFLLVLTKWYHFLPIVSY
jgi:hypothetical protein